MSAQVSPIQNLAIQTDAAKLSKRDLPNAPDGYYDWQVSDDPNAVKAGHSEFTNILLDTSTFVTKAKDLNPSPKVVAAFADLAVNSGVAENDRLGAFQAGLDILSKLPSGSPLGKDLSNKAVAMLYESIPHPPAAYLGPEYQFRQADGSYNNVNDHELGKSGTRYARSVQPKRPIHPSSLPDPEVVFDTLLRSRDRMDHLGGASSLAFAFATLVTHSLFKTDPRDWTRNNATSYLDLSPLYGNNQTVQDSVRDKASGRGLLWPDTFAEEGVLFLPPAAAALLVVLSRNHNYIADKILKINERKTWSDPPPQDPVALAKQDEDIFQTARLINGGHFMSLIMGDYVAGFLGLAEGNAWNLDAFDPIKLDGGREIARGQGNHVSVEFNLLYRWHTTTSAADEKWTEDIFSQVTDGKSIDDLSLTDFMGHLMSSLETQTLAAPKDRTFGGLTRGQDGRFDDDDVARILQNGTESAAGQYRARGTPGVFKYIEVLGILQGRKWGACTMNEFRQFLGLKTLDSFEEWNPDPEIANAARRLYKHIDNLELYTGLQCESHMPLSSGLRFSCGYTMTRAVLGDAISLIRGDRFYTTDYSPKLLTTWGFQDSKRDPDNGGFGGALPKLLVRHFPRHYPLSSVYGLFPFFTPKYMQGSLKRQGIADKYTFDRPVPAGIPKCLDTFTAINYVFGDATRFKTCYNMKGLGDGYGFMLIMDANAQHDKDKALAFHALFPSKDSILEYVSWWRDWTVKSLAESSWAYNGVSGRYFDVVQAINTVAVHWAADSLCGIPLKTKENPRGVYTPTELFDMFSSLFSATFLAIGNSDYGNSFLFNAAKNGYIVQEMVKKTVSQVTGPRDNRLLNFADKVGSYVWPTSKQPWQDFLDRLASTGKPVNELAATIVGLAIGSSVNQAQAAIHVVDFYLQDSQKKEFQQILGLIQKNDGKSNELLQGYVREAMRLNPQFTGLWREASVSASIPVGDGTSIKVQPGDRIWGSFKNAHLNPVEFPNPETVDPTRPQAAYNLNGAGYHNCIGVSYAVCTIAEVLKIIFSLKNIRRANGDAGKLAGFTEILNETKTNVFIKPDGSLTPWPVSLYLAYDA